MPSLFGRYKSRIPDAPDALPGRAAEIPVAARHLVLDAPLRPPFPDGIETAVFGLGCFWGAERIFWQAPGVYTTAVGYAGGSTPNPTYEEVCSGRTGHTEVGAGRLRPGAVELRRAAADFWESHDPTQGMRQGNDVGTQYRSAIYTDVRRPARGGRGVAPRCYQAAARAAPATARSRPRSPPAGPFYYAEDYHQQYLAKNPNGYCGLGGTGVTCPIGVAAVE